MSGQFTDEQTANRNRLYRAIGEVLEYDVSDNDEDYQFAIDQLRIAYRNAQGLCVNCGEQPSLPVTATTDALREEKS